MEVQERFEHTHVADLEQFEQKVGVLVLASFAATNGGDAGHIGKAEEAARVLPAFNGAQPGDCKCGWVIVRIASLPVPLAESLSPRIAACSEPAKPPAFRAYLVVVLPLPSLLSYAPSTVYPHAGSSELTCAPRIVVTVACNTLTRLAGFDTSESRIPCRNPDESGIHICDRTGSGHADESAEIVAYLRPCAGWRRWHRQR